MGGFLSVTSTWFQDISEEPESGPKIQATNYMWQKVASGIRIKGEVWKNEPENKETYKRHRSVMSRLKWALPS